jgi:hypothetical protein
MDRKNPLDDPEIQAILSAMGFSASIILYVLSKEQNKPKVIIRSRKPHKAKEPHKETISDPDQEEIARELLLEKKHKRGGKK